jgi:uncharacterized protein (TIGR02246 family)
MQSDEEEIRRLVATWMDATKRIDMETVLGLMTEDVVFLVPGQPPMDKSAFAAAAKGQPGQEAPQFDGQSEIQEIKILGDSAFMWTKLYDEAFSYLATFQPERITEPVPLAWASMVEKIIGRAAAMTTLGDTILQIALHTLYHRGQVNARLREVGGTPPLVDYIAWVWFGRPRANWAEVLSQSVLH